MGQVLGSPFISLSSIELLLKKNGNVISSFYDYSELLTTKYEYKMKSIADKFKPISKQIFAHLRTL